MKDITNTSHADLRSGAGGKERGPATSLFHEPVLDRVRQARNAACQEQNRSRDRCSPSSSCENVQLDFTRRQAQPSATLDSGSGAATHQRLHRSSRNVVHRNVLNLHNESGEMPLADRILLQRTTARLNSVTQSLEQEGERLQNTVNLFPFFEEKLGHLEKVRLHSHALQKIVLLERILLTVPVCLKQEDGCTEVPRRVLLASFCPVLFS
jgi:hypothetical protein